MIYKAIVDGAVIWSCNSVKQCKQVADEKLDRNGYSAQILIGRKIYDFRFYDTNWNKKTRR